MVSVAEIRRREKRKRQKAKSTAANLTGIAVAIVTAFIPNRAQWAVLLCLGFAAICIIYGLSQLDWVAEADSHLKRWTRLGMGSFGCIGLIFALGAAIWPPIHRHSLSQAERSAFEKPLK